MSCWLSYQVCYETLNLVTKSITKSINEVVDDKDYSYDLPDWVDDTFEHPQPN